MKIFISHFQPLELYPPVTNFLNYLSENKLKDTKVIVVSTINKTALSITQFKADFIEVKRTLGIIKTENNLIRFIKYIFFNFYSFIHLILFKPNSILYYETMSSWAPLFYKKFINKNCKLIVHYHEYTSLKEYSTGSGFGKLLWHFEKANFNLIEVISHTNLKRMTLFLQDYPTITFKKTLILPNYPPQSWASQKSNNNHSDDVLRLVYVGALGLETMHIESLCKWILIQNGKVTLDIYSINIASEAEQYLQTSVGKAIILRRGANYQDLPNILTNYDVGLILYKGHIPNYIYNAPNKLFEYLACKLDVWFPIELLGSYDYVDEYESPLVLKIDFANTKSLDNAYQRSREVKLKTQPKKELSYFCEAVYQNLVTELR